MIWKTSTIIITIVIIYTLYILYIIVAINVARASLKFCFWTSVIIGTNKAIDKKSNKLDKIMVINKTITLNLNLNDSVLKTFINNFNFFKSF